MTEQEINKIIDERLKDFILIDKYTFKKHIQIFNGRNITLGKSVGTKLGTEATQKLGFYGATPVDQPADIVVLSEAGADVDGTARAKINKIRDLLQELGLMA